MDERYVSQREFADVRATQSAHTQQLSSMGETVSKLDSKVDKIMTNHLPHINSAIVEANAESRKIFMEARDSMLGWVNEQNVSIGKMTAAFQGAISRIDSLSADASKIREEQEQARVEAAKAATRLAIYIGIGGLLVTTVVTAAIGAYVKNAVERSTKVTYARLG